MKSALLIVTLLLLPLGLKAQYTLSGELMYGSYYMNDLTKVQQEVAGSALVPLPIVTSFPAHWGYQVSVGYQKNEQFQWGFSAGYNSTGARAYYEDYSGMIRFDQLVKGISAGIFGSVQLNASQKWPVFVRFQGSIMHTIVDMTIVQRLGNSQESESLSLTSWNIGLRPTVGIQRNLGSKFFTTLQLGYEAHIGGKLSTSGGGKTDLTAQWDGFRIMGGIGIRIGSQTEELP